VQEFQTKENLKEILLIFVFALKRMIKCESFNGNEKSFGLFAKVNLTSTDFLTETILG